MPEYDLITGDLLPESNAPKAKIGVIEAQSTLTAEELEKLDQMTKQELIALVRRFMCQCGLAATMTKDETAQAMRDVLAETALRPIVPGIAMKADISSRLSAIDKWLDRTEGKPMQPNSISTDDNTLSLAELIIGAHRMGKPKVIDVTPENK
jgi:hypothetical protein